MRNLPFHLLVSLILCVTFSSFAQKPPIKLGSVSKEEVGMKVYEPAPDADAVVLCDYGYLSFNFNTNPSLWGWENKLQRICRIKIFNDDGYKWATEQITLYDNNKTEQSIAAIKGYTYNMENGKIVTSKLGKDNIFTEKAGENYKRVKFTMPNVKEGSVIEFSYTVNSNYILILDKWQFQKSIPVKWSEYIVSIPEYLTYLKNSQGFESFYSFETDSRARSISWTQKAEKDFYGRPQGTSSQQKIDYQDDVFHWIAKDLKGLKDEKFVGNYQNYLLSVDFQLSNYQTLSKEHRSVLSDWPKLVDKFLTEYDNFGPNMKPKSFYKDVTDPIIASYQDPTERCRAVYSYVSQYMKWDKKERFIPSQSIKKSYDDRTGSSADINALLVSMLNAVEIEADPVIISTIDNGLVHPVSPLIDKYNYLIVRAKFGDKTVLLDATEKEMPFGLLPYRCLNQRGYAISKTRSGWVDLKPKKGLDKTTQFILSMDASGKMQGSVNTRVGGYSAVNIRNEINLDGQEKYVENFKSNHTDWLVDNIEIDAPEAIDQPVKEKLTVEVSNAAEAMGNMMYINPIVSGKMEENPLKQDTRKFPIEFVVPMKNNYILNLTIPEGYTVDELPGSVSMVIPDNTAKFKYVIRANGNKIQLSHSWQIDESFYTPDKFQELKEFYAMLVAKQNEQIVLKKIESN